MTHLLLRFILILSLIRLICCQPHFISSLTQRNASTQVLVQSCEQALNMSSDQVMISLFLPFFFFFNLCLCWCVCALSAVEMCVCLSFLVPCGVSVGPEELCLIV